MLAARIAEVGLGLAQRLLRHRQADFAYLRKARPGLADGGARLRDRGARLAALELDQHLARLDGLALGHRDRRDRAGDLAADFHAQRRFDAAAGHHGLDQSAPLGRVHRHLRAEQESARHVRAAQRRRHDQRGGQALVFHFLECCADRHRESGTTAEREP